MQLTKHVSNIFCSQESQGAAVTVANKHQESLTRFISIWLNVGGEEAKEPQIE